MFRGEQINLAVYNVLGQKVKALYSGVLMPGIHTFSWDGLDALGRPAPSGIYLYEMATPTVTQTEKMILLK